MVNSERNPLTVRMVTLGCKVNQCESESIDAEFQQLKLLQQPGTSSTEVYVINTCTVTQKASMQSRQAIRKAIREHPKAVIIATGCYAQSEPHELAKIKGLDYIIGNADKYRIAQIVSHATPLKKLQSPILLHTEVRNVKNLPKTIAPFIETRTRPFIKVQDGCDNFCSYCIVPYTRGPSRSVPPDDVIHMISSLPAEKRQEIVLTGIHLGKYGLDLSPECSLLTLIKQIADAKIVRRIRLSSIEPVELSDDLLNYIAESATMCHHFHVPLQSGDIRILKKMNRPYDPVFFEKLINKIHHILPDAAIGVDVMVGFPGETENAFQNTYDLLESLPITYLHVFPYSDRPGTQASGFKDHVHPEIIKKRRNQLLALGSRKKSDFYAKMMGKKLDVLVEQRREAFAGKLTGFSSNYVRVVIDGDDHLKNKIVPCRIIDVCSRKSVYGEPCVD